MPITPLPTPPSRSNPANFSSDGDAFLGALPQMVTEINTTSDTMDANVIIASQSATLASASADAALANSNAVKWISGTTYAIGDVRWSPITFLSYRRKTAGAGTTDPSTDTTNWADIVIRKNMTRSSRTSNTILGVTDAQVFVDITAGTFTQTFAAAATLTSGWACYIRNSGSGVITLDPNSSETIDGLTTLAMYPGEVRLIQCDGSVLRSIVITPFRFTSDVSGAFIWPPGYASFTALLIGAGGGGAGGGGGSSGTTNSSSGRSGAGGSGGAGGCGGQLAKKIISSGLITVGSSASYIIGAGGAGGAGGIGGVGVTNSVGAQSAGVAGVGSAGGGSSFGSAGDLFYMVASGGGATDSGARGNPGNAPSTSVPANGVSNSVALLTSDISATASIRHPNTNGGSSANGTAGQSAGPAGGTGSAGGVSSTSYWLATGANAGTAGAGSSTLGVAGSVGGTPAKAAAGCGGGGGGGGGGSSGAVASGTSGAGGAGGTGGVGGDGRLEIWGGC